jgi:hypothetical protein
MSRRLTPTALAMILAACGTADPSGGSAGSGSGGANGPFSVQPQPIPDDGFAGRLDGASFTVATSTDGLTVSGMSSSGAAPGEPQGGSQVSALDLTTTGTVVTATADASGAFTLEVPGGSLGDRVLVFFLADPVLDTAFVVPTAAPSTAAAPCVLVDRTDGLGLGKSPVGKAASLAVTFSSSCGAAFTVDGITVAGAAVVTPPAAGFTIPASGDSASETFVVTPTSTASYLSFVILASGDDRQVFTLSGSGD